MNWRPLIEEQLGWAYKVTDGLVDLIGDEDLGWKPATGSNWLTVGQLLEHIAGCGGITFKGFADNDWETMPPEVAQAGPDSAMPPAESFPTVESVDDARRKIEADHALAVATLAGISDEELESKPAPAWWDPRDVAMGPRLVEMINHLNQHKGQLFYYLKLMGRDVNTSHLWGM